MNGTPNFKYPLQGMPPMQGMPGLPGGMVPNGMMPMQGMPGMPPAPSQMGRPMPQMMGPPMQPQGMMMQLPNGMFQLQQNLQNLRPQQWPNPYVVPNLGMMKTPNVGMNNNAQFANSMRRPNSGFPAIPQLPYLNRTPSFQKPSPLPGQMRPPAPVGPQRKPPIPYKNTYAPRIREGTTALLAPTEFIGKRKRAAATASASAIKNAMKVVDDSDDSDFQDEDEGEVYTKRRTSRGGDRATNLLKGDDSTNGDTPPPTAPVVVPGRRAVPRTRYHDYPLAYYRDLISNTTEYLVPIRLDLELDGYKLKDSFMWNIKEPIPVMIRHPGEVREERYGLTPERFANLMCDDLDIDAKTWAGIICDAMKSQISDFMNTSLQEVPPEEDMRITINLDLQFATYTYRDRFEWDLSSELTPEDFARILAADLGVGGEFVTLVSHSIHEQIHRGKAVISAGGDEDDTSAVMMFKEATRPIGKGRGVLRSDKEIGDWGPIIEPFDREAVAAAQDSERNARRMRRSGTMQSNVQTSSRRRSGVLPDTMDVTAISGDDMWASAEERASWRCQHCLCLGKQTIMPRTGPKGPKTLCNSCGLYFKNKEILPEHHVMAYTPNIVVPQPGSALQRKQTISTITILKDKGNEYHKKGSYAYAVGEYTKALAYFETTPADANAPSKAAAPSPASSSIFGSLASSFGAMSMGSSAATKAEAISTVTVSGGGDGAGSAKDEIEQIIACVHLLASILSNRAASYLLMKEPVKALADSEEVIRLRPEWVKGYFRCGEAKLALKEYEAAFESFKAALEREKNSSVIMERLARLRIYMSDEAMGLLMVQLMPGRDICSKSFLAPIQNLIFDFATQMRNFIYFVGNAKSKEVLVVDACWDIDGLLNYAKSEGLQIVGCIVTHHHIDHVGGIPPPPYDRWGVRVDGLAKLLKKLPNIKAFTNPNDVDEIIKANPEMSRDRFYETRDGEVISLPFVGDGWMMGAASTSSSSVASLGRRKSVISKAPGPISMDGAAGGANGDPSLDHLARAERKSTETTKFQFIHTPGHTAGSQCILVNSTRLLTGDTLFIGSCGRCDFPDSSPEQLKQSLEKLSNLPPTVYVFPGHAYGGEWTTIGNEKAMGLLQKSARDEFFDSMAAHKLQQQQNTHMHGGKPCQGH
ncbi:hypothetical protein HK101_011139 [Irineochytrium annulatum]|nr:hypothetical protein HK101_011139 [Irineochytrium annulatum]